MRDELHPRNTILTNTSPSERERLSQTEVEDRVQLVAPGVLMLRDVPNTTPAIVHQLFEHAHSLLAGEPCLGMIADLRDTNVPNAAVRSQLRKELADIQCSAMRVLLPERLPLRKNPLLHTVAKFTLASMQLPNASISDSVDEAIAALRGG